MFASLRSRIAAMIVLISGLTLGLITAIIVYTSITEQVEIAKDRQKSSLATAAAVMEAGLDGFKVTYGADGQPTRIVWEKEPDLSGHALIDRVGAITGETATIFAFEKANGDFWRRSTNIKKPNGARAVGTPLGTGGAVHPVLMRGQTFVGEATILGQDYYTIYFPIQDASGAIAGILYVGVTKAAISAAGWWSAFEFGGISLLALFVTAIAAYWIAGRTLGGFDEVRSAMAAIAGGAENTQVPCTDRKDEVGEIARAVDVFRASMNEAAELRIRTTEAEAAAGEKRQRMLQDLDARVGGMVKAVVQGDLSQRVPTDFEEAELNSLAEGVNSIADTLQRFLDDVNAAVAPVSNGDLSHRIPAVHNGAMNEVADRVNASIERLAGLVGDIKGATGAILQATDAIGQDARSLSSRTESQASSLEETAATMEEMSATIKSNADSARQAKDLADGAGAAADRSQQVVGEAVDAMKRIETSSTQISDIITVIDGIAFQTNLLALNAAVEAARAGDAGKGFAVVASEVRTLAQRSSEAARDIKGLIEESTSHVVDGVRLVEATGEALNQMVDVIGQMGGTISDISSASAEQASGVEEISSAVNHLDKMTQENATLADRSASTAEQLSQDGGRLRQTVSLFSTGDANEAALDAEFASVEAESRAPAPAPAPAPAKAAAGENWAEF